MVCVCTYIVQFYIAAKEKEKAAKLAAQKLAAVSAANSRAATPSGTPTKKKGSSAVGRVSGTATPAKQRSTDQQQLDISGLNLNSETAAAVVADEPPPKVSFAREALLEEARRAIEVSDKTGKKGVSIVVIGMLMSRLWFSCGSS